MIIGTDENVTFRNTRRVANRPLSIISPYYFTCACPDNMQTPIFRSKVKIVLICGWTRYNAAIRWVFPLELAIRRVESVQVVIITTYIQCALINQRRAAYFILAFESPYGFDAAAWRNGGGCNLG